MKSLNHLFKGGLILSATILFFSCTKQIQEPTKQEVVATVPSASAGCKPTVLGALVKLPNDASFWETYMQKWYDGSGKLSNIKATINTFYEVWQNGDFKLPFGTVTYQGNQVYVHDNGKLVMRVTLNGDGKPEASYFYMQSPPNQYPQIDTSYYTYSGEKLTHMQTLRWSGSNFMSLRYNFIYDMQGNIIRIETGNSQGSYKAHFKYNYGKSSNGMLPYYVITIPFRLLEYMDLVKLPMNHELTQVWIGEYNPGSIYPYETYPVFIWNYTDHLYNGSNLIERYQVNSGVTRATFYTGWDCGSNAATSSANKSITSLQEFNNQFSN